jgi:rubredoxin
LAREMVRVKRERFEGWACSNCAWIFRGSGPLRDESIEAMKRQYEAERDNAFNLHVCVAHPRERGV